MSRPGHASGGHRLRRAYRLNRLAWDAIAEAGTDLVGLAQDAGTARTLLSDVLGGRRKLSVNLAVRLEEALGRHGLALELLSAQLEEDVADARGELHRHLRAEDRQRALAAGARGGRRGASGRPRAVRQAGRVGTFVLTRDTTEVRRLLSSQFATPTSALSLHGHMPLAQVEEVLAGRRHVTALQAAMLARVVGDAGFAEALLVAQARAEALAACALLDPGPRERRTSSREPQESGQTVGVPRTGERRSSG